MSKTLNEEATLLIEELRTSASNFLRHIKAEAFWPAALAEEQKKRIELFSYILTLIPKTEAISNNCEDDETLPQLFEAFKPGKDIQR